MAIDKAGETSPPVASGSSAESSRSASGGQQPELKDELNRPEFAEPQGGRNAARSETENVGQAVTSAGAQIDFHNRTESLHDIDRNSRLVRTSILRYSDSPHFKEIGRKAIE
jgi:hypothetical protein